MKRISFILFTVITAALFIIFESFSPDIEQQMKYALVIHGGAGYIVKKNISDEQEKEYRDKLQEALQAGEKVLKDGGSALDAVEAAITVLEDSPLFNAGKGSVFTHDEQNEMDASIMDGKTLNAGAVAGVHRIKNPIKGAKAVLEKSEHVMLAGDGADAFAKKTGLKIVSPSYFKVQSRLDRLRDVKKKEKTELDHSSGSIQNPDSKFGTVGCVALDSKGNIAAGTSTGGMTNKRWDRIGDSPIIGAGTYASNKSCGVSCTGHGEYYMRAVAAYDVCARMELQGKTVLEAADETMNKIEKLGGQGGIIALDINGNVAMPFNTPGMFRAYKNALGKEIIELYGH